MLFRFPRILPAVAIGLMACIFVCGQTSADERSSIYGKPDEDKNRPKTFGEMLEKLRIQKEKKEFDQMIARGEEVLKISSELENAFAQNGKLSDREITKVETVEKLVKKIRGELGGDDDDSEKDETSHVRQKPSTHADAVKSLRSTTAELFDLLKKTTRFTISAAAIQTSNAVIKIARFLRIAK